MTTRSIGPRVQRVTALDRLPNLNGEVTVVTGGTDGVGRAVVEQLAAAGATVVLPARNLGKADRVRREVADATGNDDVHPVEVDLASLASVQTAARAIVERWPKVDLVIANAAHQAGRQRTETVDGFETTFAVNQLALTALLDTLEPALRAATPSRIVVVASEAHRRAKGGLDFGDLMLERDTFRPKLAYNRSKLANILFTREAAQRLAGTGITIDAVHPGGVDTPMMRANFRSPPARAIYPVLRLGLLVSPADAAAGVLRVALDPDLAASTGAYFELGHPARPTKAATDDVTAARLRATVDALLRKTLHP